MTKQAGSLAKLRRVSPGDLIAIPLAPNVFGVGLVLHVSKTIRNAMMVGYLNVVIDSANDFNPTGLSCDFIETPNYTGTRLVAPGRWQIIGHSQELLDEAAVPHLRWIDELWFKDEVVRKLSPRQYEKYGPLEVSGGLLVEDSLREHFGIGQSPK